MKRKSRNSDAIEIVIIDSNRFSVELMNILFDMENIGHRGVVGFDYPYDALKYLRNTKDKKPKLILLETINHSGANDFSFLEEYSRLERNDFIYVVTVSIEENDKMKCLSYNFIWKYINKPIVVEDIREIIQELGLKIKENNSVMSS